MNLSKMTDKELNDLANEIETEKNRRKFLNKDENMFDVYSLEKRKENDEWLSQDDEEFFPKHPDVL